MNPNESSDANTSDTLIKLPAGREEIMAVIPHRDPFLLVDGIESMTADRVVGFKDVREDEAYFKGHFPGNPVMPGVLICEAMAQTLGVLILSQPAHRGKLGYFASMDKVKFRGIVRPGERIVMDTEKIREKKRYYYAKTRATVNGKVVCEAEMMLFLAE
ncbi:MAG: 3-hydroxyacyl-ACP dehydratase FabZ [Candidatus Omnitrophica bacterium]|nr:3-hydroxyacyl-ACP dehydratase FabZ [Candidatus Omnitrophota bacterium]